MCKAKLRRLNWKRNLTKSGICFVEWRTEFPQETILTGSHIDTVVNGGTLDGQYGVIASMTAVQYLLDKYGKPRRL